MKSLFNRVTMMSVLSICVLSPTYAASDRSNPSLSFTTRSSACEDVAKAQVVQNMAEKVEGDASKIFAWGRGPEETKQLLQNLTAEHVQRYKQLGLILEQAVRWQRFYETELRRNPCDASAPFRAAFLKKVVQLW